MRALLAALAVLATLPALGCPVAIRIDVENRTGRIVQALTFDGEPGIDHAPAGGLRPGQTAAITLPDCVGRFTALAALDDGTTRRIPGIAPRHGQRITLD